ncbi:uncharacterized protein LOC144441333 [Glandiceps talaboti]
MATPIKVEREIHLNTAFDVWHGVKAVGYSKLSDDAFAEHLLHIHRQYCGECFPSECQQQGYDPSYHLGQDIYKNEVKLVEEKEGVSVPDDVLQSTSVTMMGIKSELIDDLYQEDLGEVVSAKVLENNSNSTDNYHLQSTEEYSKTSPYFCSSENSTEDTAVGTCFIQNTIQVDKHMPINAGNSNGEPYPIGIINTKLHAYAIGISSGTPVNSGKKCETYCKTPPNQRIQSEVGDKCMTDTKEKSFICTVCGKGFKERCKLDRHTRIHTNHRPCVCKECGKGFNERCTLKRHTRIHTNEKLFVCNECGKGFMQSCHLKSHARIHTNETPFVCKECGKGFCDDGTLMRHIRIHTNERPFVCKECRKRFCDSFTLKRHLKIHSNERLFVCKECGKGFNQSCNLRRHIRIHTNDRPYVCKKCGKTFRDGGGLKKHMRIHTNGRPFEDHLFVKCGKAFHHRGNLRRHIRVHTNDKPFVCTECGKAFTQSGSLKKHKNSQTEMTGHLYVESITEKWY